MASDAWATGGACWAEAGAVSEEGGGGMAGRIQQKGRAMIDTKDGGPAFPAGYRPTGAVTRFCECGGQQIDVWTDGKREVAKCHICGKVWDMKTYEEIEL